MCILILFKIRTPLDGQNKSIVSLLKFRKKCPHHKNVKLTYTHLPSNASKISTSNFKYAINDCIRLRR